MKFLSDTKVISLIHFNMAPSISAKISVKDSFHLILIFILLYKKLSINQKENVYFTATGISCVTEI